jgi:hypothetical protein
MIFFSFYFKGLSRSYDLVNEFDRLVQVTLIFFWVFFYFLCFFLQHWVSLRFGPHIFFLFCLLVDYLSHMIWLVGFGTLVWVCWVF